jgi:CRP-like cAMP-binding protein
MELGADDYLTKPFEEAELLGAVESRIAKMAILEDALAEKQEQPDELFSGPRNIHELKNFMDDEGTEYTFHNGVTIYKEGDNSNTVFLVLEGIVKTHKLDEQGKELITGIFKPDEFFGIASFSRNIPYTEYATAIENVKLVGITKEVLKQLLHDNHDLAIDFMQYLTDNLTDAKEQLLQMAYGSVRRKTAATILKFAEKLPESPTGSIHILRSDLASVAGIATETLIRTLSNFKDEGLIAIENRDIRILDMAELKRIH